MVSQRALQDFKKIWANEFGQTISEKFAMEQATNLLTLFDAVYRPINKEWVDTSGGIMTPRRTIKKNCRLAKNKGVVDVPKTKEIISKSSSADLPKSQ